MELKRTGFYLKSYHTMPKNNTAKWKGRNLFSYSVSGMSQVVSTKRVLALVRVKLWPLIFPQKSKIFQKKVIIITATI